MERQYFKRLDGTIYYIENIQVDVSVEYIIDIINKNNEIINRLQSENLALQEEINKINLLN